MPEKEGDFMQVTLRFERGDPQAKEWLDRFGKTAQLQTASRQRYRDPLSTGVNVGLSALERVVRFLVDASARAIVRRWARRNQGQAGNTQMLPNAG